MCSPPGLPLLNPISCCSAANDSLRTIASFTVLVCCSPPEYCGCLHCSQELSQHCAQGPFAIQWQSVGRMAVSHWIVLCKWGFTVALMRHSSFLGLYWSNGMQTGVCWVGPAVTDFFKDHVFFFPLIKFSCTLFHIHIELWKTLL